MATKKTSATKASAAKVETKVEEAKVEVTKQAETVAPAAEEKPAKKTAKKTTTKTAAKKTAAKKTTAKKAEAVKVPVEEKKPAEVKAAAEEKKPAETKAAAEEKKPAETKAVAEEKKPAETEAAAEEKKPAAKKTTAKKTTTRKAAAKKTAEKTTAKAAKKAAPKKTAAKKTEKAEPVVEAPAEIPVEAAVEAPVETPVEAVAVETVEEAPQSPRRSVVFIGSECYPFVKTGGLGDVMYALPKMLAKQNCDVRVIIPRYKCIPQKYQDKMIYRGSFDMDLCSDGRNFYVGIMEYIWDGVVYDFIDNEEFFSNGNPYTSIVDDIPKYCYFGKAALSALLYMDWIPDVIHCHDWQTGLVPVYLRTLFDTTALNRSKVITTIHNLRFQGIYNISTIQYWSGLPDYVFNKDCLKQDYEDANMFKGGLAYSNMITTVSNTYAGEIQTGFYGENLDAHLRYHSGKLRGIVNGIDYDIWNSATDELLAKGYDVTNVIEKKKANKRALQEALGLEVDDHKMVLGLISRLTNQKGLDLLNSIIPQIVDDHTQIAVLGTGDPMYEDSFRYYENAYKGKVCSSIMYDEERAHKIYAGCDALLVPSQFEPCGLTQLIGMHYGTVPIVRETGGLKDTVEPYNMFTDMGNGFTFDRYDAGLLLDAINRAKTLYFEYRENWDKMVVRDMQKDVSWEASARQYKDLYLELTPW